MNVRLPTQELLKELEPLEKILGQKPPMPILNHVVAQADVNLGGLRLAATDLDVGLITSILGQVHAPGTVTLPIKHLLDILRLISNPEVDLIQENGGKVHLVAGEYHTHLPTHPPSQFPKSPSLGNLSVTEIPPAVFKDMLHKVNFAIAETRKNKYAPLGALLLQTGDALSLVAIDGPRLAIANVTGLTVLPDKIVIPKKTVTVLEDMLTGARTLSFAASENHLFFAMDGRMLWSKMVEAKFPSYTRSIPRDCERRITIPRGALLSAVKRIALTYPEVVFRADPNGTMELTAKSAEMGAAAELISLVDYTGGPEVIVLNGKFLSEFLEATSEEHIMMEWKDKGVLFTAGSNYCYLQMPVVR